MEPEVLHSLPMPLDASAAGAWTAPGVEGSIRMVLKSDLMLQSSGELLKLPIPDSPQTNQIGISRGEAQGSVFFKYPQMISLYGQGWESLIYPDEQPCACG